MNPETDNEARIVDSWQVNAAPWTAAVRERQIGSRRLVTDQAVVQAISDRSPRSLLDIGCGEGWLARAVIAAMAPSAVAVLGVDAVPELVERAREAGGGEFAVISYEDIAAGQLHPAAGQLQRLIDVAVCNFSLLGNESVQALLAALPPLLNERAALIIQTLHPAVAGGDLPYRTGWREGSWAGFSAAFSRPAPWYFRTLQDWVQLHRRCGLRLVEIREPLHPTTQQPASIIFVSEPVR
ncbi:MAG TPA: class I SAM-dependent methyltransferase [Steroidobacteraceae bacterium]|nr:class I SAM-dependent methyltransferase [Steroidobacteraceae bacterium]